MKHPLNIGKKPSLQKIVIASVVLHLLFITFVAIPIKTREREFRSYYVKLVGPVRAPSIGRATLKKRARRALPQKKKIEKVISPKKAVKAPPADMSLERVNRVAKKIEKLRAIHNLSKRKKVKERIKEIEVSKKEAGVGIQGEAGIPGKGENMASDSYYALLTRKIWSNWVYPDFESSGLEMIISIKIDKNGKVISREIEKTSGSMLFDRSAIKAITKASPLPPPPFEMEVGVRFYL